MMNKNNYLLFSLILLFCMCKSPNKENRAKKSPNYRIAEQTRPQQQKSEQSLGSNAHEKDQTPQYINISNPDTALAYFFYETHSEFKPFQFQEEYQRLDLEYDKQKSLIKSLFADKGNLDEVLSNVKLIRKRFIDTMRVTVYDDYKKYHGVSGMTFDFLLARNDSLVKPLLYKLASDSIAPKSEREYAAKVLIQNYEDSTFEDLLK